MKPGHGGIGRQPERLENLHEKRKALPLTATQKKVHDALLVNVPSTTKDLAAATGLEAHSIRSVLLSLQGKSLAERRNSDSTWTRVA